MKRRITTILGIIGSSNKIRRNCITSNTAMCFTFKHISIKMTTSSTVVFVYWWSSSQMTSQCKLKHHTIGRMKWWHSAKIYAPAREMDIDQLHIRASPAQNSKCRSYSCMGSFEYVQATCICHKEEKWVTPMIARISNWTHLKVPTKVPHIATELCNSALMPKSVTWTITYDQLLVIDAVEWFCCNKYRKLRNHV
jgi:hypothetical protein